MINSKCKECEIDFLVLALIDLNNEIDKYCQLKNILKKTCTSDNEALKIVNLSIEELNKEIKKIRKIFVNIFNKALMNKEIVNYELDYYEANSLSNYIFDELYLVDKIEIDEIADKIKSIINEVL